MKIVDLAKENNIPGILTAFNDIVKKGFDPHLFIGGLGSHFRDLMMAQNPSTLALIEVGENTKQKFSEQSKNSKNPRLTVEIALMQLASLTAAKSDDKKKVLNSSTTIS